MTERIERATNFQVQEAYQKQQDITNEIKEQTRQDIIMLKLAAIHAETYSGCSKVRVGTLIIDIHNRPNYGANRVLPGNCSGMDVCQVDGHCVSTVHSEIDAIVRAKRDLYNATLYVTRYPCESCARAIVTAGIKAVIYGRPQKVSKETDEIFFSKNVIVRHVPSYLEEDAANAT